MNLILWRHAEAEDGMDDLARELTAKGRRQAQKMADVLRGKLPENRQIWVSRAARSRQTAAYLGAPTRELPELNPEADARQIAALLAQIGADETVVIVGHQPWIGQLCAFLLNQSWQTRAYWSVKKGGFWWFECLPHEGVYPAKLKLMLTP